MIISLYDRSILVWQSPTRVYPFQIHHNHLFTQGIGDIRPHETGTSYPRTRRVD